MKIRDFFWIGMGLALIFSLMFMFPGLLEIGDETGNVDPVG